MPSTCKSSVERLSSKGLGHEALQRGRRCCLRNTVQSFRGQQLTYPSTSLNQTDLFLLNFASLFKRILRELRVLDENVQRLEDTMRIPALDDKGSAFRRVERQVPLETHQQGMKFAPTLD